jgi:outer membrane protein
MRQEEYSQRDDIAPLLANTAPPAVARTVLGQYPGAEIREVERESWKGEPAWEVELTTAEGDDIEVFLSESGEILDVSKGLPVIGGELTLGFGAFYERSPYKGVGYETDPIPIIRYHNGPLQIVTEDGIEFSYGRWDSGNFSCRPLAALIIGEGFEADDSDDLRGMDEPDMTTFHAGLSCIYTTPYVDVEFKFLNEVAGEHSGQQVELSLEREWEFGDTEIEPSVSVQYQSSDWTDYYYGISRSESRPGRPVYDPGSAFNFSTELMIKYELTSRIGLIGMVECTYLDDCIRRSPIIERDLIFEVFGGIMYSF